MLRPETRLIRHRNVIRRRNGMASDKLSGGIPMLRNGDSALKFQLIAPVTVGFGGYRVDKQNWFRSSSGDTFCCYLWKVLSSEANIFTPTK